MSKLIGPIQFIFLMWLIWQPVIINSQPGNTFIYAGIDWKADNLDGVMFWIGILIIILFGVGTGYEQNQEGKKAEHKEKYFSKNT